MLPNRQLDAATNGAPNEAFRLRRSHTERHVCVLRRADRRHAQVIERAQIATPQ
jgi:hypothetical protein